MQIKGKDVIGLNVIDINTGTILETVDDIAYNPSTHRVEALLVNTGGLFSSAKAIHIDDVHNIGEDAVIVHDSNAIKSVKDLDDTVHSIADSNKHLVKTNVLTSEGKELGKVTDIYFDSANGTVSQMEVSQGGLKTISEGKKSIKPSDIVTIGADATIVSTYTEMKFEKQAETGGLKGKLNETKDKVAEVAANTKERVENNVDKVAESSGEITESVKKKSAELKDVTDKKVIAARQAVENKASAAKESIDTMSSQTKVQSSKLKDEAQNKVAELSDAVDKKAQTLNQSSVEQTESIVLESKNQTNSARPQSRQVQATKSSKKVIKSR
jgi:uncharacterized protein YrrD